MVCGRANRGQFAVVVLIAMCITAVGCTRGNPAGFSEANPLILVGDSRSTVIATMGLPMTRGKVDDSEVWQYCETDQVLTGDGDDYVAIRFHRGKVAEIRRYKNFKVGNCASFFKDPRSLAWVQREPESTENRAKESSGSAFVVAPNILLTNSHVVEGCGSIRVDGTEASVVAQDRTNDLAILRADIVGEIAKFRLERTYDVGEAVMVIGFPLSGLLADDPIVTKGIVNARAGLGSDTRFLQISAQIQPGNSGGPVLDMEGRVVGVVVAKLSAIAMLRAAGDVPQDVNFAIKSGIAKLFLESNGIRYSEAGTSSSGLANVQVSKIGQSISRQIICLSDG